MKIKPLENHDMATSLDGSEIRWFEIELEKIDMNHLQGFLRSPLKNTKYLGGYKLEVGFHGEIYTDPIICEVDTGIEVNLDDLAYDFCGMVEREEF